MEINFVDLKAQYATIAPEVNPAINRCIESADFILGRGGAGHLFADVSRAFTGTDQSRLRKRTVL
jgi:hypothetical protein